MEKIFGICRIERSGEWSQTIEILFDGCVAGYVVRLRTDSGRFTVTRNLQGEVMEGECLEWLLRQSA